MAIRVVQNFGLFWERHEIEWGKTGPGNPGHLKGYRTTPDRPVDFRRQRGIYVLYEGDSIVSQRVAYVGQAGAGQRDLFHRLRQHRKDHLWNRWGRFSWFGFLAVGAGRTLIRKKKSAVGKIELSTALDQIEAVLISLLEPLKNKQGPRWQGASEYFQLRKSDVESG